MTSSRQVTEPQSKPHVTTEVGILSTPNTSHVQRLWIIQFSKESTTNIAPPPPAGLHTPVNTPPLTRLGTLRHRKEARESNLADETALNVAEIPEAYVIFLCYSP